jgi:ferredoxin
MEPVTLPEINLNLCDGCGKCAAGCPQRALTMQGGQPVFSDPAACTYCIACEELCPTGAIRCEFEIIWEANF